MPLAWPGSLPALPLLNWSGRLPQVSIRTKTDTGPAKMRRRYTAGVTNFSGLSLLVTAAQRDTFETFYNDTLAGGTLRFEWQRPDTGATVEMRFTSPAQFRPINHQTYRVVFDIEALP